MGTLEAVTILAAATTDNAATHPSLLESVAIIVGVVSGVSGLVLGILNYLHQRDASRPRLAVQLYVQEQSFGGPKIDGLVGVCNVGSVPVMIDGIVFFQRTRGHEENLYIFPEEVFRDNSKWPGELKPQDVAYLRFSADKLPEGRKLGRVFIETMVGDRFKTSRRDMRRFVKQLEAARLRQPQPATPYTSPPASQPHGEAPGPAANTASSP
jgi:hypothetical protein